MTNEAPQKPRELTRKQKAFVKHLIDNPKESATKAVLATYDNPTYQTARSLATENLAKPAIISELAKYNNLVENTLLTTIQDWGREDSPRKREIAQDAAKYIHDKVHGKATQKVEQTSTQVSISIDLTSPEAAQDVIDQ